MEHKTYLVLPEMEKKGIIPFLAYCQLVCAIPYGMVAKAADIEKCLCEIYGENSTLEQSNQVTNMKAGEFFPYWRIVSDCGHLMPFVEDDREFQQQKLQAEGLQVLRPNPEQQEYVVANCKEHLFDFGGLHIRVILGKRFAAKQLDAERKRIAEF